MVCGPAAAADIQQEAGEACHRPCNGSGRLFLNTQQAQSHSTHTTPNRHHNSAYSPSNHSLSQSAPQPAHV